MCTLSWKNVCENSFLTDSNYDIETKTHWSIRKNLQDNQGAGYRFPKTEHSFTGAVA